MGGGRWSNVGWGSQPGLCSFVQVAGDTSGLVGARLSFSLRPRALISRDFLPVLTAVDSVHPS